MHHALSTSAWGPSKSSCGVLHWSFTGPSALTSIGRPLPTYQGQRSVTLMACMALAFLPVPLTCVSHAKDRQCSLTQTLTLTARTPLIFSMSLYAPIGSPCRGRPSSPQAAATAEEQASSKGCSSSGTEQCSAGYSSQTILLQQQQCEFWARCRTADQLSGRPCTLRMLY